MVTFKNDCETDPSYNSLSKGGLFIYKVGIVLINNVSLILNLSHLALDARRGCICNDYGPIQ